MEMMVKMGRRVMGRNKEDDVNEEIEGKRRKGLKKMMKKVRGKERGKKERERRRWSG